ncbi:MAG: hypothetical protein KatS3mg109_2350 [Pirellulaceae bacterium]|nr:MAG: hypothetical protein KatS3mg109_2350 [Pirellulaceae bacterium]
MSSRKVTLALVGLVFVSWVSYAVATFSGRTTELPPPELYIEPAALDLGTLWESDSYVHSFSLQNRSSQPVTITGWYRSCPCQVIEPQQLVLGPGETAQVRLTIDLKAVNPQRPEYGQVAAVGESAVAEPEPVALRLWLQPKLAGRRQLLDGWSFTGTVRKWAVVHPAEISVGEVVRGVAQELSQATVVCFAPIKTLEAVVDPAKLLVQTEALSGQPPQYRLRLFLQPELTEGPLDVRVGIRATTLDGRQLSGPSLTVFGRVVPSVTVLPSAIYFSPAKVGTSPRELVVLQSRLEEPFQVLGVEVLMDEGAQAEVKVEPVGGEAAAYQVEACIRQPGSIRRQIVFRVRTQSGREETIRVPLLLYGLEQEAPTAVAAFFGCRRVRRSRRTNSSVVLTSLWQTSSLGSLKGGSSTVKSQVAFYAVAFVLWPVLAVLAVVPVGAIVYAQLNCQERRCVEVRYQAKDPNKGDIRNIYCVRTEVKDGKHFGFAYSDVVAVDNCYGQNSRPGNAIMLISGHRWKVVCEPDCKFIPNDSLCSGVVIDYTEENPERCDFRTKCFLMDPQPDPGPDPGP